MDRNPERTITLTISGRSDRGLIRSENQDYFLIADLGRTPESGGLLLLPGREPRAQTLELGPAGALALVADGMGGAAGGELASRLAAETILDDLARSAPDHHFALRLRTAVEAANARIHQESRGNHRLWGMGTTATAAGILGDQLYIAQIGDSRAYLIRGGAAHQLTRDQSRVQALIEAGELTPEEAAQSAERHIILQALGPEPEVDVDLTHHDLCRGDTLLLSSDGLHGVVDDDEIARIAAPHLASTGSDPDPDAACQALIDLANQRGGPDNITVVIIHFEGPGLPEPRPDHSVTRQPYP